MIETRTVRMEIPEEANLILGQAHFIKTAEDLYEAVVNTVPGSEVRCSVLRGVRAVPDSRRIE